jgi:aminoglycoside phosphotransferase (APT) family kinase protein
MLVHRYSWIWAVLPSDCRRIVTIGEPQFAELARGAGFEVDQERHPSAPERDYEAALIAVDDGPDARLITDLVARFERVPLLAFALRGGPPVSPEGVRPLVRALQLLASPYRAARTVREARALTRVLRRRRQHVAVLLTGDRSRRYSVGRDRSIDPRRLPAGAIVTAVAGPPSHSIVEDAIEDAGRATGLSLVKRRVYVLESAKLVVDLCDGTGRRYVLRVAGSPARGRLEAALSAIGQIAAAKPPPAIAERVMWPVASGEIGPVRYTLEPRAPGRHPFSMTPRLWGECIEFLAKLYDLDSGADRLVHDRGYPDAAPHLQAVAERADDRGRQTLERVGAFLSERLAGVRHGWAHGDFWNENLFVNRGRLVAVIDWDTASPSSLPALDLMDLIALSGRRTRDMPAGTRLTRVFLPAAQHGGGVHMRSYCRATGTPGDRETLTALAIAYWLDRVGRELGSYGDRPRRPHWTEANVHSPLRELAALSL